MLLKTIPDVLVNVFLCYYCILQIAVVIERAIVTFIASSFPEVPANLLPVSFFLKLVRLIVSE